MASNPIRLRTVVAMALLATAATLSGYLLGRSDLGKERDSASRGLAAATAEGTGQDTGGVVRGARASLPAPDGPIQEAAVREAAVLPPGDLEDAERARLERVVGGMWWHREPMQELLGLDGAQVEAMNELCREHILRRWKLRAWQRQEAESGAGVAVHQALEALDLETARRALEARADLLGWLATADGRLEVKVLDELRGDQLEILARERPVLLRRPWLKAVGRGALNARRGGEGAEPPG